MSTVGWLEKLQNFVKLELKITAPLIDNSKTILIDSSQKSGNKPLVFDKRNQTAILDLKSLTEKQKEKLVPILREYLEEDNRLLEIDTDALLEKLYRYNKETTNQQIVAFFRPIIPPADLEALEASLYLRDAFRRRENVAGLKEDIREEFGSRGNNIANLCTAGYFEEFLMPLYNASKERFSELYALTVGRTILAVFVYHEKTIGEIKREIERKLKISRAYGIRFIHIHGIGEHNVAKIKECVEKYEAFFKVFHKKIFEKENICIIELRPK